MSKLKNMCNSIHPLEEWMSSGMIGSVSSDLCPYCKKVVKYELINSLFSAVKCEVFLKKLVPL